MRAEYELIVLVDGHDPAGIDEHVVRTKLLLTSGSVANRIVTALPMRPREPRAEARQSGRECIGCAHDHLAPRHSGTGTVHTHEPEVQGAR